MKQVSLNSVENVLTLVMQVSNAGDVSAWEADDVWLESLPPESLEP